MLIRHECCGVAAPGSGGGTPCATSQREMEALVSCKNHNLCAWVENTQGARVRKEDFSRGIYTACSVKPELLLPFEGRLLPGCRGVSLESSFWGIVAEARMEEKREMSLCEDAR